MVRVLFAACLLAGCSVATNQNPPTAASPVQAHLTVPTPAAYNPNPPAASTSLKSTKPVKLSAADIEAVKAGVRKSLKDAESARFGTMKAGKDEALVSVCGYVNAKNSYGGYTGERLFAGGLVGEQKKTFVVVGIGENESGRHAAQVVCSELGLLP